MKNTLGLINKLFIKVRDVNTLHGELDLAKRRFWEECNKYSLHSLMIVDARAKGQDGLSMLLEVIELQEEITRLRAAQRSPSGNTDFDRFIWSCELLLMSNRESKLGSELYQLVQETKAKLKAKP